MKKLHIVTNRKVPRVNIFVLILLIFFSFFLINQVKSIPMADDDDDIFSSANNSYELIITSPNDGDTFDTNQVTLEWELLPPSCLIYIIYRVQIDNQAFKNVGTDTSYHFTGLEDGKRTLRVLGLTDSLIYTDSINIIINTSDKGESSGDDDDDEYEEPKIEIISPNDSEIFHLNEVTLRWELTNSESCNLDYYEVRNILSESWINVGTDNSYQFTNLDEGEITLQVRAIDENGNTGSTDTVTIIIDSEEYTEEPPPIGNGETTNPPPTDGDDDDDKNYNNNDRKGEKSNNKNDEKENQNEDTNNKEKTVENGPIALFNHEEEQNSQTKSNFKLPSLIGSITNFKIPEISWIIVIVIISLSIVILLIYLIKSKSIYLINKI